MLKLLAKLIDWIARPADVDLVGADPLQHPAIERMSERERADLPFTPAPRQACCAG